MTIRRITTSYQQRRTERVYPLGKLGVGTIGEKELEVNVVEEKQLAWFRESFFGKNNCDEIFFERFKDIFQYAEECSCKKQTVHNNKDLES